MTGDDRFMQGFLSAFGKTAAELPPFFAKKKEEGKKEEKGEKKEEKKEEKGEKKEEGKKPPFWAKKEEEKKAFYNGFASVFEKEAGKECLSAKIKKQLKK
jgi:hypothetical protein